MVTENINLCIEPVFPQVFMTDWQKQLIDDVCGNFVIGVDMARGQDMTATCIMERMKNGDLRVVDIRRNMALSQKKILKIVHRAMINAGLPPSKHRSNRVAKKLYYRNFPRTINVKFTA